MVSIIVSSHKEDLFLQFSKNVQQTIGDIPYEIIQINNPGLIGICQAYNIGARKAKYTYIIFSHEDILFHADQWGITVRKIFEQDSSIGLVGCIGGYYKSLQHTGWAIDKKYISSYMIGTHCGTSYLNKTYNGNSRSILLNDNMEIPNDFKEKELTNESVLMLDGMFLITKKCIHEKFPFDEKTFKGFHCYDLDYSFQLRKYYKIVVNHNILIEHFSSGNFDQSWLKEMKIFNHKWKDELPVALYQYTDSQKIRLEFTCFEIILRIYKNNKLSYSNIFKQLFYINYINKVGLINWLIILFKIIKKFTNLAFKYGYHNVVSA